MPPSKTSGLCPRCKRLVSTHEKTCPYCGLSAPQGLLRRLSPVHWLHAGNRLTMSIIWINIFFYVISLIFSKNVSFASDPFSFLAPDSTSLLALGASGTIPIQLFHAWYTLISANWLHSSLLHLGFNMAVIYQLVHPTVAFYGTGRTVLIYIVGGIGGFFGSYLAGIPFTVGASAALCALIGSLLFYGKHRGGPQGHAIYRQLLIWAIFILGSGFLMTGINNWAHLGGFISGILLGWAVGYQERLPEKNWMRTLANFSIIITLLVLAFCLYRAVQVFFL